MTWSIGPITLPIDPKTVRRRVARKQVVDKIAKQLPFAVDTGPEVFELVVSGLIWPSFKAFALWELVKKAENPSIELSITGDNDFSIYNGRYAVSRADSGVSGPKFIDDATAPGGTTAVHDFNITFIQFADQGSIADGDTGELFLDEDGVGFGDINIEIGDFDFGDFLLTFGGVFS